MFQCIAAVLGSLAAPTAVDYNEAQDKPQEIKEEDAIPQMTSTDSDGEDHSTNIEKPDFIFLVIFRRAWCAGFEELLQDRD